MTAQRLQLTWYNKDKALIPTETGKYGYTWVDPSDPRYCETHTLVLDDYVQGSQTPKSDEFAYSERADLEPQDDNLLILGESGDVLEALTRVPELAEKYVGKVKLIYIDPPFNTAQTFASYEDNLEHSIWLTMMRDRLSSPPAPVQAKPKPSCCRSSTTLSEPAATESPALKGSSSTL